MARPRKEPIQTIQRIRFTTTIDKDLYKKLRIYAIQKESDVNVILEGWIEEKTKKMNIDSLNG